MLVLLVLLLPTIASTSWGTGWVVSVVNGSIPGRLDIDDLEVGWSKGQSVTGLMLTDPQGESALHVEKIEAAGVSLWGLIRGGRHIGQVTMIKPAVQLDRLSAVFTDARQSDDEADEPSRSESTDGQSRSDELHVQIKIVDAKLNYADEQIESLTVTLPNADVEVNGLGQMKLDVEGSVELKSQAMGDRPADTGTIHAAGTVNQLFSADGQLQWQAAELEGVKVELADVPVALAEALLKLSAADADAAEGVLSRLLAQEGALDALIGPQLNAELAVNGRLDELDAKLAAESEHLKITARLAGKGNEVSLVDEAIELRYRLTPAGWQAVAAAIPALKDTRLAESADVAVRLADFRMLLDPATRAPRFDETAVTLGATIGDLQIDGGAVVGAIALRGGQASITSAALGRRIEAHAGGQAEYGGRRGEIEWVIDAQNLLNGDGQINESAAEVATNLTLSNWPTGVVDSFAPGLGELVEAVAGKAVNVELTGQWQAAGGGQTVRYDAALEAANVSAELRGALDGQRFKIDSAQAQVKVEPAAVEALAARFAEQWPAQWAKLSLKGPALIRAEAADVEWPMGGDTGGYSGSANLAVTDLSPAGVDWLEHVALRRLTVEIPHTSGAAALLFKAVAQLQLGEDVETIKMTGRLDDLIGDAPTATVTIASDLTVSPATAEMWRDLFADQLPPAYAGATLAGPVRARVELDQWTLPLKDFSPQKMTGAAAVTLYDLQLRNVEQLEQVSIEQVHIEFPVTNLAESLSFAANVEMTVGAETGKLTLNGSIAEPLARPSVTDVSLSANTLPIAIIEPFAGDTRKLAAVVSPWIDQINVTMTRDGEQWAFIAAAKTARVEAKLSGGLAPTTGVSIDADSFIDLTITPDAYQTLTTIAPADGEPSVPPPFELTESARVRLDVTDARIAFAQVQDETGETTTAFDPAGTSIHAKLSVPRGALAYRVKDGTPRPLVLSDVTATVKSMIQDANQVRPTSLIELTGSVETVNLVTGETESSPLTSTTQFTFPPNRPAPADDVSADTPGGEGEFDLAVTTHTELSQLPVPLIDALLNMEGKLTAAVGPVAKLKAEGQVPGPLVLHLSSETIDLPLALQFSDQYAITLADDINASFMLTEQSAKALLSNVHPIFNDAVASEKPVTVLIRKDPFHLPTKNLAENLDKLELDMTLNLGELRMQRRGWIYEVVDGMLEIALRLAGALQQQSKPEAQTFLASFTPMDVRIKDGRVQTSEVWLTSDNLSLGFQGTADLVKQEYKFFMGLVGASLVTQAPFLIEIVDPTNVYDVPIEGKVGSKPKIDKKEMALALGGSTVKQQLRRGGEELQAIFDVFAKAVQTSQRKRQQLQWNKPQAVVEFEQKATKRGREAKKGEDAKNLKDPKKKRDESESVKRLLKDLFKELGK